MIRRPIGKGLSFIQNSNCWEILDRFLKGHIESENEARREVYEPLSKGHTVIYKRENLL